MDSAIFALMLLGVAWLCWWATRPPKSDGESQPWSPFDMLVVADDRAAPTSQTPGARHGGKGAPPARRPPRRFVPDAPAAEPPPRAPVTASVTPSGRAPSWRTPSWRTRSEAAPPGRHPR